jgi:hypothetical protein
MTCRSSASVGSRWKVYHDVDYIIACDAGRGRLRLANGHFAMSRMKRSFEVTYRRARDASRARLHDAAAAGLIQGFAHCYLACRMLVSRRRWRILFPPTMSEAIQQISAQCRSPI